MPVSFLRLQCVSAIIEPITVPLYGQLTQADYLLFPREESTLLRQFDQESGRRRTTLWMCYVQIIREL